MTELGSAYFNTSRDVESIVSLLLNTSPFNFFRGRHTCFKTNEKVLSCGDNSGLFLCEFLYLSLADGKCFFLAKTEHLVLKVTFQPQTRNEMFTLGFETWSPLPNYNFRYKIPVQNPHL